MTWLAVLISGVLLNNANAPIPNYPLVFTSSDDKLIKTITDKEGKFQVELEPGVYDVIGQSITVGNYTSTLKLKQPPFVEAPKSPHVIEIIRGNQGDVILPKDVDRTFPGAPNTHPQSR